MKQPSTNLSSEGDLTTPRLFRLRDLHPSKTAAKPSLGSEASAKSAAMPVDANRHAAESFQLDAVVSRQVQPAAVAAAANEDAFTQRFEHSNLSHRSGGGFAQDELNLGREPESTDSLNPRTHRHEIGSPEGRSWMESAITHRKVLIMLAIAVGAAFWTSRNPQESGTTESALVTTGGSLEFGVDQFDIGTSTNDGSAWDQVGNAVEIGNAVQRGATSMIASAPVSEPNAPGIATATEALSPPVSSTGNSLATLSGNVVSQNTASVSESQSHADTRIAAERSPVQSGATESLLAASSLDVQAVSSRTPHSPSLDIPSIDELEEAGEQSESELVVRDSATPNGVADWLRYLPQNP